MNELSELIYSVYACKKAVTVGVSVSRPKASALAMVAKVYLSP